MHVHTFTSATQSAFCTQPNLCIDVPDLLDPVDAAIPLDCCIVVCGAICDEMLVAKRGVGGPDAKGERIFVEIDIGRDAGDLRKTRAGGNWLMGGMSVAVVVVMRQGSKMVVICSIE